MSPGKSFKPMNVTPTKGNLLAPHGSHADAVASIQGTSIINYPTSAMFAGAFTNSNFTWRFLKFWYYSNMQHCRLLIHQAPLCSHLQLLKAKRQQVSVIICGLFAMVKSCCGFYSNFHCYLCVAGSGQCPVRFHGTTGY